MTSNQAHSDISDKIEIQMLFKQKGKREIIVDRIHVSKDAPQRQVCDAVLYKWGHHPNIDNLSFMLAQDEEGSVIVTKPDLLKYVETYKHLYA